MSDPPQVFIVEDEAIVAEDIGQTLRDLGYAVAGTEKSGERALDRIRDSRPDLVLMDIHLAGTMDGIAAAGRIHADLDLPVIFLTAYADSNLLERAKQTEPYGYIIKPYDARELHSVIEMALYKHRMERRIRENENTLRLMVNATSDLLYLLGADGKFIVANEALAERAGTDPDGLTGTSAYDLVGRRVLSPRMACWQLDARGERRITFEEELPQGWYDVTICPLYDERGAPEKYAVSARNSTAKKRAEEQLRNNEVFFRTIIEEASEIVVLLNPDGSFPQQSPSFTKALGYGEGEDPKKDFFDHISLDDWQQAKQAFFEVLAHPGMAQPVHLKFSRKDRGTCTIRGIISNLSDNPFVGKIVLNGWVDHGTARK